MDPVKHFEATVEQLLDALHKASVLLEDYRPENQARIVEAIGGLPARLDAMAAAGAAGPVADLRVPKELFDFLEEGQNPDLFTRQLLASAVAQSELCKGKVEALAEYRDALERETVAVFPEMQAELQHVKSEGAKHEAGSGEPDGMKRVKTE
jgi:mediator of RNA polymerase II transcription subunit 10